MLMSNDCFAYYVKRFRGISLLAGVIFLIFFSQSFAGTVSPHSVNRVLKIDPERQFDFAEHYFLTKEYFRAIGEYKRFIFFFPDDDRVKWATFQIGMSYFKSDRFKEAIDSFNKIIEDFDGTDLSIKSYWMISDCYVKLKEPGLAILNLNNLITLTDDMNVRDEAYYKTGWICIETGSWEKARLYFSKISSKNKSKYRLEELSVELDKERLIPKKNPRLSGFLSIIPGAGFFYCERYRDALAAFLLNGGLIYAAYESFDNGNNALGGAIGFVEMGFYGGNIYGAVSSAHKYNRTKTRRFIEKVKYQFNEKTTISLSAGPENKSVLFSFQYTF